jgi:uncharacterized membrane protein YkoI
MIKMGWTGIAFVSLLAAGCGGGQGKDYLIRHAAVTLSQAVDIAEKDTPGRAVKAELESGGRRVTYQVEIVDVVNKTHKVWIDAETGKVLK